MNHDSSLEDSYFRLLVTLVRQEGQDDLLKVLYDTTFFWLVPNDVNRAEDGRELRLSLLRDLGVDGDGISIFDEKDINVLEVLAALAQRASMVDGSSIHSWFETFLFNLELDSQPPERLSFIVEDILADWMERRFDYDGQGGLFPLRNASVDQRRIEIWNQMSAYIIEDLESRGFFN